MKTRYLVVDTAALVKHVPLWEYAETLYSVPEIITEIRDKDARRRLEALPFPITMRQPQPQSIKFVNEFSKKTGDYASLSLADIKVLALTYELEVEVQGSASHLNAEPHRIVTEGAATKTRQRKHSNHTPQQDTARREETERTITITEQHIRHLDTFLLHHSYITGYTPSTTDLLLYQALSKQYPHLSLPTNTQGRTDEDTPFGTSASPFHHTSPLPSLPTNTQGRTDDKDTPFDTSSSSFDPALPSSRPTNTQGRTDEEDTPFGTASSFHHTFPHLTRWMMHIATITKEDEALHGFVHNKETLHDRFHCLIQQVKEEEEAVEEVKEDMERCALDDHSEADTAPTHSHNTESREEEDSKTQEKEEGTEQTEGAENEDSQENNDDDDDYGDDDDDDDDGGGWITCENIKKHRGRRNVFGDVEEEEEEEKDVKVACITGDFAIQNVLKHIGLVVMGVDGRIIKHLKTYILRCHACFKTTSVMDKIFCPHCGNKTLKKVSVTLDPDGTQRIWINNKRPINKKGTKYSLPTPKGGKHGRNPILVADQREAKRFSSKMSRKKINPLHEDYNPDQTPFAVRDVYSRAAQLGYIGGKNHNHFYWEKRNPNEPQRRTGKK